MTTELATTDTYAKQIEALEAHVAQQEASGIIGDIVGFAKGDWTRGAEKAMVDKDELLVALPFTHSWGFVRWEDGKATDSVMVPVISGKRPMRHELGDLDKSRWPVVDGAAKDPWQYTEKVLLREFKTESLAPLTYVSTSKGGFGALNKLAGKFVRHPNCKRGLVPVVKLGSDSYRHDTYGKVIVPTFTIVAWTNRDNDKPVPLVDARKEIREELAMDEVPF